MLNLTFPDLDIGSYKSMSQKARVLTESWVEANFYCLNCGHELWTLKANTRVYDFICSDCEEKYQLKSSARKFKGKILGAEYKTTIESIQTEKQPSLILLHYEDIVRTVEDLDCYHRSCISPSCIIPRKPLSRNARRTGWQGCLLDLNQIPDIGKVSVIKNGVVKLTHEEALIQWQKANQLTRIDINHRGWLVDILKIIEKLPQQFTLEQVYAFENHFATIHPENHNIRPKIRQQLQRLRDIHLLTFVSPGVYQRK